MKKLEQQLQKTSDAIKNKTTESEHRRKEVNSLTLDLRDKKRCLEDLTEDL
jgi:hypothetical protein